jgi:hypothetical protein
LQPTRLRFLPVKDRPRQLTVDRVVIFDNQGGDS